MFFMGVKSHNPKILLYLKYLNSNPGSEVKFLLVTHGLLTIPTIALLVEELGFESKKNH